METVHTLVGLFVLFNWCNKLVLLQHGKYSKSLYFIIYVYFEKERIDADVALLAEVIIALEGGC